MSIDELNINTQLSIEQQAIKLIENALNAKKIKCLLITYFAELDIIRLHKYLMDSEKLRVRRAHKVETLAHIIELSCQSNEITKIVGEVSHSAHDIFHFTEQTSKLLIHSGGIGTVVAGILGFTTIPVVCALENRRPKPSEIILMGLSITTIVLGSLAVVAVGGPIGVGAFILSITSLGLVRTSFSYFHEWRERKALEKEVALIEQEVNDLDEDLDKQINNVARLKKELMAELGSTDVDQPQIDALQKKFDQSSEDLQSLVKKLENNNLVLAHKSSILLDLREKRTSRWELAKKGIYISAGILAVVGAALMLTPAAPLGGMLMLLASMISVTTLLGSLAVHLIKHHQTHKQQIKVTQSLHEAETIESRSDSMMHSSEYHMVKSLTSEIDPLDESMSTGSNENNMETDPSTFRQKSLFSETQQVNKTEEEVLSPNNEDRGSKNEGFK